MYIPIYHLEILCTALSNTLFIRYTYYLHSIYWSMYMYIFYKQADEIYLSELYQCDTKRGHA